MLPLILLLAALLWLASRDFGFVLWYRLKARSRRLKVPPFVWYWPLGIPYARAMMRSAQTEQLLAFVKNEFFSVPDGHKTYFHQGIISWVALTRDPENIKALLATQFTEFSLGMRTIQLEPVFGSGIFTQDGMQWKHSRAMLRPQFSREQISRLESLQRHIDIFIDQIKGKTVNVQELFFLLTMDSATEFLFNESVHSLSFSSDSRGILVEDPVTGDKIWSSDFVESYTWLNKLGFKRIVLNGLSWITRWTDPESSFHLRRVHAFVDNYVHAALLATANPTSNNHDNNSIRETDENGYIFSHELAKETRDPVVLRNQILNILIAGRDTTASTLSFATFYLAKYPHEWNKLREEVAEQLPQGTPITYENLRKLQYTHRFIKEVLRLAPVVPLNVRTAVKDTTLPRGGGADDSEPIFLPKGTEVTYSPYVLHRDPSIYGSDAEIFRPDRWSPLEREKNSAMNTWGYIPFNGGPRICLGQQFALTEISLVLVKLAQSFAAIEPAAGFPEHQIDRTFLTLQMGGPGVPVHFKEN